MQRSYRAGALAALVLSVPTFALTLPITVEWSRGFGGNENDETSAVAVDQQGNIYVTGSFRGTVDFGGGPIASDGERDVYLLQLDPAGAFVRVDRFGSFFNDYAIGVGVDQVGNTYVAGFFQGTVDFGGGPLVSVDGTDLFVASFDDQGNHRWSKRFDGSETESMGGLVVAPDGACTIVGQFKGTIDFGGGPIVSQCEGGFAVRFESDGDHVWSRSFTGICLGRDGTMDFNASAVASAASGNCFVGVNSLYCNPSNCEDGGAATELDASGNNLGSFGAGTHCSDVDIAESENICVTGMRPGTEMFVYDPFVARYSATHEELWALSYSVTPSTSFAFKSTSADTDGGVLALGLFRAPLDLGDGLMTSAGDYDMFALYLTPSGEQPKSYRIGGTGRDEPRSSARAGEPGAFIVVGDFEGQLEIDGQPLVGAGGTDFLVAKIRIPTQVAVAIEAFYAKATDGGVILESRFRSDLGVVAVNVYRADRADLNRIAQIADVDHGSFHFVDRAVEPGHVYRYQIGVVDADGEFLSDVATVAVAPIRAELGQNQPNPFNPTTSIRFTLAKTERMTLSIFDQSGHRVRTLVDGIREHGPHEIVWDGRDDAGNNLSSGVYFYRLSAGSFVESKKMVLLK